VEDSVRLGRIMGIPVGMHWSVLVIVALLVWALATGWLPERLPDTSQVARYAAAVVAVLAFFGSLLAHELAHAVVARRHGIEVEGITLWLLGGVARLDTAGREDPRIELRVAVVGPLTSLGIAAVAAVAWVALGVTTLALVSEVVLWLAVINAILAVFNLMPALPLDGGRLYRAVLWARTGDKAAATRRATVVARRFGHVLVAIGVLEVLLLGLIGGLWLVLLGWFIGQAAQAEESQVMAGAALQGRRVADVMTRDPVTAPDWLTVDRFIDQVVTGARMSTYPLVDLDGSVTGLVTLRRLASVPPAARATTRVRDVAVARAAVVTAQPDEPAIDLFARLRATAGSRALVFDDGQLVGIVSPIDVARTMEIELLRHADPVA
jgi:Zn-dependent protease